MVPGSGSHDDVITAPLSFSQERVWRSNQARPGTGFSNVPLSVQLRGNVDENRLQAAIENVVRRHESLRTRVMNSEEGPLLVVQDTALVPLEIVQCSPEELDEMLIELARQPFLLSKAPLLRVHMIRTGDADVTLLLNVHHIVFDGWSSALLLEELAESYAAYEAGREPRLPELTVQYADYSFWLREKVERGAFDADLTYWQEQLAGCSAVLNLPRDVARPPTPTFAGLETRFEVSSQLAARVQHFAQQGRTTPNAVLLAAWVTLLARLSGQHEIIVGSAVAGRSNPEVRHLIGFFSDIVALRLYPRPEMSFRDLVAEVTTTVFDAVAHQDAPLSMVMERASRRDPDECGALYETVYAYERAPKNICNFGSLEVVDVDEPKSGFAKWDVSLHILHLDDEIQGQVIASLDVFTHDAAKSVVSGYLDVLSEVLENPERSLAR